ncbi:MAG: hypothetical protein RL291_1649, partial [Pseudomonadota bacterium]
RIAGFTKKYNVKQLVWFEDFAEIEVAIEREKSIKRYLRIWKIRLIEERNSHWIDLFPALAGEVPDPQFVSSSGKRTQ